MASGKSQSTTRVGLRMLLLFPLVCGYVLTFDLFPRLGFQYFALTLLAIIAGSILLLALDGPLHRTLPVWLIFLIFLIAHQVEFYLLAIDPSILEAYFAPTIVTKIDAAAFIEAYAASTAGFVAFCFVSIHYLQRRPRRSVRTDHLRSHPDSLAMLAASAVVLILTTSVLTLKYNLIGTWNRELLPFHLEGIIDYIRLLTIPLLLFSFINTSGLESRRGSVIAGVAALLLYAVSDMLLRTSKGTLVSMGAALLFLRLMSGGRLRRSELAASSAVILVGLALFPILLAFRMLRAEGLGIFTALAGSGRQIFEISELPSVVTFISRMLVLRLTGSGAVLALTLRNVHPLGWHAWAVFWGPRSWSGYINVEIFGTSEKFVNSFGIGSSAVGLFYVLGGIAGAGVGCGLLCGVVLHLWEALGRCDPRLGPAAQVVFLEMSAWTIIDGNISLQWLKGLGVLAISLIVANLLLRLHFGGVRAAGVGLALTFEDPFVALVE